MQHDLGISAEVIRNDLMVLGEGIGKSSTTMMDSLYPVVYADTCSAVVYFLCVF